jgi:hypothetical protein
MKARLPDTTLTLVTCRENNNRTEDSATLLTAHNGITSGAGRSDRSSQRRCRHLRDISFQIEVVA